MTNQKESLIDGLGRELKDLRVSVTDRCNLRCRYCMPAEIFHERFRFLPDAELLSFQEIALVVRVFSGLGVRKVRLTGGEPLVRKGLPQLVERIRAECDPALEIALTSNGLLLPRFANALRRSGLNRVNVSLDALDPVVFRQMSGGTGSPGEVIDGIKAADVAGLPVSVNCVVQSGVNETEILPLAHLCRFNNWTLRFIEFMDVGNVNGWSPEATVSGKTIRKQLTEGLGTPLKPLEERPGVAENWIYADTGQQVGFIESITRPFCANCVRARITAKGELLTCLFASSGTDLRALLRKPGLNTEERFRLLSEAVAQVWSHRKDRYSEERSDLRQKGHRNQSEMWQVGG